jgi:hypothetical protein
MTTIFDPTVNPDLSDGEYDVVVMDRLNVLARCFGCVSYAERYKTFPHHKYDIRPTCAGLPKGYYGFPTIKAFDVTHFIEEPSVTVSLSISVEYVYDISIESYTRITTATTTVTDILEVSDDEVDDEVDDD